MLNFNHLYYFHLVASEGSVKAAADRLGVTQPTVSEQVRMLERALGLRLFERTPSGLRLTTAGRDAFEHTTAMFRASERLVEVLGHTVAPPVIALRVGVSASMSRTIAASFLMPLLAVEKCRPSIRTSEFGELLRDLRSHELDLIVGEGEPLDAAKSGLEVCLVHRPVLVAVTHPDIEARDDWKNLALLEYRSASPFFWDIDNFLKERSLHPTHAGELDDAFLMLEAVARGGFVAFVPRTAAREAVASGRVKALATLNPSTTAIYAVYHSSDTLQLARDAVKQLVEHSRVTFDRD